MYVVPTAVCTLAWVQIKRKIEDFIPKLGLHVDIHNKLPQKFEKDRRKIGRDFKVRNFFATIIL